MQADHMREVEQERQRRIDEMAAEDGPRWSEAFKPGSFGCHELLDRTMMAESIVDQFVLSHPACVQNPEWFALAWKAVTALAELYQRIGATHLDEESSP